MSRLAWLLVALVWLGADLAAECRIRSPKAALEGADVVFRGRVREIRLHPEGLTASDGGPGVTATFDVSRVWKGHVGPVIVLRGGPAVPFQPGDEPYQWFEPGEEFVVFASEYLHPSPGRDAPAAARYRATSCGGTVSMLRATPYLLWLGAGRPPVHLRPGSPDSSRS